RLAFDHSGLVPDFRWPEFRWPEFRWPEFRWPEFRWPEFRWPEFRWPELRGLEATCAGLAFRLGASIACTRITIPPATVPNNSSRVIPAADGRCGRGQSPAGASGARLGGLVRQHVAEQLPGLAVEAGQLDRLDGIEVGRAGVDLDAGQQ